MTTECKTNDELARSSDLARRNLARLAAQKANPLPLPPMHPEDGARRYSKRAAQAAPTTRLERERMDAERYARENGISTGAAPLTIPIGELCPGKPMEECESLLDP